MSFSGLLVFSILANNYLIHFNLYSSSITNILERKPCCDKKQCLNFNKIFKFYFKAF